MRKVFPCHDVIMSGQKEEPFTEGQQEAMSVTVTQASRKIGGLITQAPENVNVNKCQSWYHDDLGFQCQNPPGWGTLSNAALVTVSEDGC